MKLPLFIARKYFFSTKKRNFINVISIISMIGVAICTAALIVVLSVFNGLESLLEKLYGTFDPQIKIEASKGKSFEVDENLIEKINSVEGVEVVTEVIEDYAYVRYRDADMVATIKGVSENFLDQHRIDQAIVSGELKLKDNNTNYAIIGRGIQYALSIMPGNDLYPLQVYYIKDVRPGTIDINKMYSKKNILPGSVFAIEKNYDENFIFVPLDFAAELLNYDSKRTSLELLLNPQTKIKDVERRLQSTLGNDFNVLTNQEQHADLYRLLKLEKLFVFISFSLILAVGSLNIFFSLTMLGIDKKKDISVLYAMGANNTLVRRIFIFEGAIISLGGAIIGMALGGTLCYLQQTVGLVSMGMETSVLENYPVKMNVLDFIYTSASLIIITILISYRPAILATKYNSVAYL